MQKLVKRISLVMVALMTVFTALSYMPAKAATVVPQVQFVGEQKLEYTAGERITFNLNAANYGGRVQYRVVLWNDSTKSYGDLWNTADKYYTNWMPYGNETLPLGWVINEPGTYRITVYAKRAGIANSATALKGMNCDSYLNGPAFVVKPATTDAEIKAEAAVKAAEESKAQADVDAARAAVELVTNAEAKAAFTKRLDAINVVLQLKSLNATKANELKVTFNKAVADKAKASFEVKNGSFLVPVTVAWNEANTEATLTKSFGKYLAGDYTVTVKGLELAAGKDVVSTKVEDERIEKIEFTSTSLVKATTTTATIEYKVYNQYNEDITATASVSGVSSFGTVAAVKGVATVTKGSAWAATDTVGTVTLYTATKAVTATVNIVEFKALSNITLGSVVLPKDTVRLTPGASLTGVKVEYAAVDQYGNAVTLDNITGLTFVPNSYVSNIRVGTDPVDATKKALLIDLTTAVPVKTTVTLTVIVNATGKTSTTSFDVYPAADVVDFTLTPDAKVIKAGTPYKVWIDAVDTYGNAIKATDLATYGAKFSMVTLNPAIANTNGIKYDATAKRAYIEVNPIDADKATNMVVTLIANGKSQTLPISVSKASEIVGMTLPVNALNFADGGSATVKLSFIDQYGEAVKTLAGYTVDFTSDTVAVVQSVTGQTIAQAVAGVAIAPEAGQSGKTAKITVTLKNGTTEVDSQVIAVKVIDSAKTTLTYSIADIDKLNGLAAYSASSDYAATLELTAKDASGNVIYVPNSVITAVTSTNPALVEVQKQADGSYVVCGLAAGITTGTEATASLTAIIENYDGTVSIATKPVTVSKAPITPASLKAYLADGKTEVAEAVTGLVSGKIIDAYYAEDATFHFKVVDQYGVTIKVDTFVITNNTTGATAIAVNAATGVITWTGTPTAGTSFNITAITSNGLTKTVKVQF